MKKYINLTIVLCLFYSLSFSQSDTSTVLDAADVFKRISKELESFKLDTTAAPNDKITKKIIELRNVKGGFNINEAIKFKIGEDKQKNESSIADIEKLATFFQSGDGKRLLDNAMIWIYREHFTYSELTQLVKFYKSSAGKKMSANFPLVMLKSLAAAETIKTAFEAQNKN